MAIDLAALKAKLAARTQATTQKGNSDESVESAPNPAISGAVVTSNLPVPISTTTSESRDMEVVGAVRPLQTPALVGTSKTSQIDHLDFLSKMNALQEAIHKQHPTMPVLLMQIHKQLRADPELVTTLDEEAIGVIVTGLQIHTKTELIQEKVKESKSKAKKIAVSVDML